MAARSESIKPQHPVSLNFGCSLNSAASCALMARICFDVPAVVLLKANNEWQKKTTRGTCPISERPIMAAGALQLPVF